MNVEIDDMREPKMMRIITFSNYKKTDVKKELIKSITNKQPEYALHWCVEMLCSGYFLDLWNIFILYSSQYIHLGNPKLFIYLSRRLEEFRNIMRNGHAANELSIRNNNDIRKMFFEITSIIITSDRKHGLQAVKTEQNDFDMTNISDKFYAPSPKFVKHIFREDDPQELYISCNELYYHLSESNNNLMACYWCQWIVDFEKLCKKKKKKCLCETRSFVHVDAPYVKDCVWIIWEIFLDVSKKKNDKLVEKIIESLLQLFMVRYGANGANTRKMILYCCVSFLTESVNPKIQCVQNSTIIDNCLGKMNTYFSEIKKNEQSSGTDYLFNGIPKKSNLDKTMERLTILQKNMF
uniref:Uncharacterized protein n=1 Tax=viral metagenome TaxID=1070528 RepID=A0A6C0LX55_9ZZZZ|tara:strand:+ start:3511 stop:4563 length:1053 start_codon:yes stop_codon:yes gene_type:complete